MEERRWQEVLEGSGWRGHLPVWGSMSSGSRDPVWEGCGDPTEDLGLEWGGGSSGLAGRIGLGFHTLSTVESWSFAVHAALEVVDDALERQSPDALLEALLDPVLALRGVRKDFTNWYLEQLSSDREQKAQVRLYYLPPAQSAVGWG